VALLRAILLTLNQSAIPGETPTVPPAQEASLSEIVTATGLMYASLLISLLAAFVAMLGKQWLNRYLRNSGGSMIERCGDRQRKCDGLKKWPLHFFVESLPVMLQVALLLLGPSTSVTTMPKEKMSASRVIPSAPLRISGAVHLAVYPRAWVILTRNIWASPKSVKQARPLWLTRTLG